MRLSHIIFNRVSANVLPRYIRYRFFFSPLTEDFDSSADEIV